MLPPLDLPEQGVVRPTQVIVDLDALVHNFRLIRQWVRPARIMAILKANAYGHGLVPVARLLEALGVDYLGVAVLEEGIVLRRAGIRTPILVLGGILGSRIPLFLKYHLTLTASSVEKLRQINEAAEALGRRARVHLKIDTGMERIGVHAENAERFLEEALRCRHLQVEGIYSHFANADLENPEPTRWQWERFLKVLEFFEKRSVPVPLRHIANSAALVRFPETHLDMVRPGILLYGVYPSPQVPRRLPVKPALSWKSHVVFFKVVPPGRGVSYGWTWKAKRLCRVVTVPVGYGDGYFRALSNRAQVLIRGKRYPQVGAVCMDQMMVHIGWDTAYNGDEVMLIGCQGSECITVEEVARWAGTIPYEVLTNINTRVPRVYRGSEQWLRVLQGHQSDPG